MNRPFLSAAALLAASVSTNASALSVDDAATGVHTGNGSGDLVLAIVAGNESLLWDLSGTIAGFAGSGDLTFNDIRTLSAGGASFSLSNSAVSAFLTPARAAIAKWHVFGVTNVGTIGDFVNTGDMPVDFGIVLTIDGPVQPVSGGDLNFQVQSNAQWLSANVIAGLADNGVLTATIGQAHFFESPTGDHLSVIAKQDATADSLDTTLAFYYLQKDPSRPSEPPLNELIADPAAIGSNQMPAIVRELGSFTLAADGTLSFVPVPVPAAAWMLGSGVLALAGVIRRRV